jgi:hypothetical protein
LGEVKAGTRTWKEWLARLAEPVDNQTEAERSGRNSPDEKMKKKARVKGMVEEETNGLDKKVWTKSLRRMV